MTVELAGDVQGPSVQVDVPPAQAEDLALPEPGTDREGVERSVPVVGDGV